MGPPSYVNMQKIASEVAKWGRTPHQLVRQFEGADVHADLIGGRLAAVRQYCREHKDALGQEDDEEVEQQRKTARVVRGRSSLPGRA